MTNLDQIKTEDLIKTLADRTPALVVLRVDPDTSRPAIVMGGDRFYVSAMLKIATKMNDIELLRDFVAMQHRPSLRIAGEDEVPDAR